MKPCVFFSPTRDCCGGNVDVDVLKKKNMNQLLNQTENKQTH